MYYPRYIEKTIERTMKSSGGVLVTGPVIHLEDGRWAAVEIKLGGDKLVEEGAASLLRLKKKLEEKSDEPDPEFLMVLTATGAMYQRPDGVIVMPINCLKA